MAVFDKASLVMIPSQYKEGKIYNIKPEDQSSSFEFERGSIANRVNSDGLIEYVGKGSELVINGSFDSDSDWSNGTNIAIQNGELVFNNTSSNQYARQFNVTETSKLYILTFEIVTLSSGAIKFRSEGTDKATYSSTGTKSLIFTSEGDDIRFVASGTTNATIDNVSVKEINTDTPRLDYRGTEPALLLEPQRTNLVVESELISEANVVARVNFEDNSTLSPDGLNNATKIIPTTENNSHFFSFSDFNSNIDGYTQSIYVKSSGYNYVYILLNSNAYTPNTVGGIWFDIQNGVKGSATVPNSGYNIEAIGSNGWYRIYATHETNGTATPAYLGVSEVDGVKSFAGDGTKGVYVYGAQIELGSYATSYIPTNGQTETRLADVCQGGGDSTIFNDSEGVLFAEIAALTAETLDKAFSISDGTANNRIWIGYSTSAQRIYALGYYGGALQFALYKQLTDETQFIKVACRYKDNDFSLWVDGELIVTDTSGTAPTGLSSLQFNLGNGGGDFYGKCKALHYFPEALTDTELQQLTTI